MKKIILTIAAALFMALPLALTAQSYPPQPETVYAQNTAVTGSCAALQGLPPLMVSYNATTSGIYQCVNGVWTQGGAPSAVSIATTGPTASYWLSTHDLTLTGTSIAAGSYSFVGSRGSVTLASGKTITTGYVYGTQGKFILQGVVNGSSWDFGLQGQLDLSAATLTAAAHVSPLWSDAGATAPSGTCAFCDGMVITNTTAATFHDVIYAYSKAAYFADLTDNGGGYLSSGSGASSAVTGYIKVKINGADAYIRVYAGAS